MSELVHTRRKRNSSKVNLTVSVVVHTVLVLGLGFFAAREGMLGKQLKTLAVVVAPKEKKPEPPKPKAEEPKVEPRKVEEAPKVAVAPPPRVEAAPPPPAVDAPPAGAPEAVNVAGFEFNDGAREVQTGDANTVYKAMVERVLRSQWNRPEDINDENYVAEAELSVDTQGNVGSYRWLSGSGDARWDKSVKAVLAGVKSLNRPPPKGFPSQFKVRFDVETSRSEALTQITAR